jgi:hypothetical protein
VSNAQATVDSQSAGGWQVSADILGGGRAGDQLRLVAIVLRTVGPTLGADAIRASVAAAVIGATLTILFIAGVNRLAGVLAAVAP